MNPHKRISIAIPVIILVLLTGIASCDKNRIYEAYVNIPNERWHVDHPVQFSPEIVDTFAIYNIYVNIRNTSNYDYNNLFLFLKTTSPAGDYIQDTLEMQLADAQGDWLGRGLSNVFFNRALYKRNVRFPVPGTYTFEMIHGMRSEELEGIRDVGLRIETLEY